MRLLHVIASVERAGGGPIAAVAAVAQPLRTLGCETEVVSLDHPDRVEHDAVDAPIHAVGQGGSGYRYSRSLVPWLKANASRFDATIVHGIWTYHSFATWSAFGTAHPYFLFPHGMLDPWFKRAYPLKHLKKLIYWTFFERKVLRDARSVLFTCEQERTLAKESFPQYHCRETVVNFGTSASAGNREQETEAFFQVCPHMRTRPFLLFLGRLHPKKGADLLIRAYARLVHRSKSLRLPCPDLVIAGPPVSEAYLSQLKELCVELALPLTDSQSGKVVTASGAVTFCPMIIGPAKWGALRACEAFVLPSHQENFGIAVAEAMSCERPVLISDQVNIWREIKNAGAGLIDSDTLSGTERLLFKWQDLHETQRTAMGREALTCFQEKFETGRAAESLLQVVRQAVGRSPRLPA